MANKRKMTTRNIVGCDVLPTKKLKTIEDRYDQEALATLLAADEFAADIVIGGVLLPVDAGPVRLTEAIGAVSGRDHHAICDY